MQQKPPNTDLSFMKMHGAGNDFVIIDSQGRDRVMTPKLARAIGNRNYGVGFDQLAEIRSTDDADVQLDFWNADGTTAGACGNATRCIAQFLMAEFDRKHLTIKTKRGLLTARIENTGLVSVNMGKPQLRWSEIPLSCETDILHLPIEGDPTAVGMGNPHCVFFVDDVAQVDVAILGAEIEHHHLFPEATNVEFVQLYGKDKARMRVWERGVGITLACGSGACAVAIAAHQRGLTGRAIELVADGGILSVDWRDDGVWLSGPTATVFTATLTPEFLSAV